MNTAFNSANTLMANFTPKDQITWVTTGSYTNNDSTIVSAWGYTENTVQLQRELSITCPYPLPDMPIKHWWSNAG